MSEILINLRARRIGLSHKLNCEKNCGKYKCMYCQTNHEVHNNSCKMGKWFPSIAFKGCINTCISTRFKDDKITSVVCEKCALSFTVRQRMPSIFPWG